MIEEAEPTPELSHSLALAFAPLHKRAFGVALGTGLAAAIALITVIYLARGRPADINLGLLKAYFWGYTASWAGVLIGAWWGFVAGFVDGSWLSAGTPRSRFPSFLSGRVPSWGTPGTFSTTSEARSPKESRCTL
jgi:hypothetical protein